MVKAIIYKNLNGKIIGYKIKGHANYDDYGKDIVCAAVSVLAQNTLISMFEVLNLNEDFINYRIDDKSGYIEFELIQDINPMDFEQAQILLKSLEIGIKSIADSYSEHVTLNYEGV